MLDDLNEMPLQPLERANAMGVGVALASLVGYYTSNPGGHGAAARLGVAALLAVVAYATVGALSRLEP